MANVRDLVRQLEACDNLEPGTIHRMALEAIEKNAGILGSIGHAIADSGVGKFLMEGLAEEKTKSKAALVLAGIGAVGGLSTLAKAYGEVKYRQALHELKKDPQIADDLPKAVSIAEMVKRWAPAIAADPQILSGTVKSLMKFPDSYLTYDIAAKLSDAQKRYADTHGVFSVLKERVF
jgi:hypothetical protein